MLNVELAVTLSNPSFLFHCSLELMDKTKSKLAAFFDNDDEENSFPVRRTRPSLSRVLAHKLFSVTSKRR